MTEANAGGLLRRERSQSPEALLLSIADALPERVEPRCRHFGQCGGCQLQQLPSADQLRAKQQMLVALLQSTGLPQVPPIQTHAAEPWQYRNRVRLRVQGAEIGYNRRSTNEFLPITECPILSPLLWRAARTLQQNAESGEARWPLGTDAIELLTNADETALQLSIGVDATVATVNRDAPRDLRLLAEALQADVPELAGAGLSVAATPDPKASRRIRESARVEIARWGAPTLPHNVSGNTYQVTRGAFFQVNRYLTGTMQHLVTGGRSGALAYDLYAGAGLFSVPLTQSFRTVIAVEIGEPAATDLQRHLVTFGPQHRAIRSTAADFLRKPRAGPAPDLIVLDPPRAGLGAETAKLLAAQGAREIVYVSCDAETFALDARTLVHCGYTLAALHLLDLFPQTFHTETVAVFRL